MPLPAIAVAGIGAALLAALRTFLGWLLSGAAKLFSSRLGTWIAAALGFFGLQLATENFLVTPLLEQAMGYAQQVEGDVLVWLGVMQFDRCLTMLCSAVAIRYGIGSAKVFLRKRV